LRIFPAQETSRTFPSRSASTDAGPSWRQTFEALELTAEEVLSFDATFIFPADSFVITHSPDCLYA